MKSRKKIPERIVAEVSKNWPGSDILLSERFEEVITDNAECGFALESWQLTSTSKGDELTESIIAVFVKY
jgi:hypothetical protein